VQNRVQPPREPEHYAVVGVDARGCLGALADREGRALCSTAPVQLVARGPRLLEREEHFAVVRGWCPWLLRALGC
jgi:hypothetical protein